MNKRKIAIIGDVHGKWEEYRYLTEQYDYSIQVGDLGIPKVILEKLDIDSGHHKFFGGNHDHYNEYRDNPYALGEYGCISHLYPDCDYDCIYFVRGAFSIDYKYQVRQNSWYKEEELEYKQGIDCLADCFEAKPDLVLSHTCPTEIARIIGNPDILRDYGFNPKTFKTSTGELLQSLFDIHQPKLWIFGHFHKDVKLTVKGTEFQCLKELGVRVIT